MTIEDLEGLSQYVELMGIYTVLFWLLKELENTSHFTFLTYL